MKKIFVLLLILTITVSCEKKSAGTVIPASEIVNEVHNADKDVDREPVVDKEQEKLARINELNAKTLPEIFAGFSRRLIITMRKEKNSYTASYYYSEWEGSSIGFESSGVYINLSNVNILDDALQFEFITIWIGAEEIEPNERRVFRKYNVSIPKAVIVESIVDDKTLEWIVYSKFILDDIPGSVQLHDNFYIKQQTVLHEQPADKQKQGIELIKGEKIKVLDAVCDEADWNKYWIQVKTEKSEGWVPLEALSEHWVARTGKINDDRVRLRSEPNLQSETFGYLQKETMVKIMDGSKNKQKVGNMEAYWYKVELADGKTGWVYGAYVDVP